MKRMGVICCVFGLVLARASTVAAHPFEFGVSIEPQFVGLPAVADDGSIPTLSFTAGGAIGIEFMPVKYLSLTSRLAYTHPVVESRIGQATFSNRTGDYFFSQAAAFALAGLRLETPTWWIPVQFFVGAQGGLALFIQDKRELRNSAGVAFEIPLPTIVKPTALVALSGGLYGRVSGNVRLNAEGTVFLVPTNRVLVGFGVTLGITFLFFV